MMWFFFFQAEDGIRDKLVTGVQTCALPISLHGAEIAPLRVTVERVLRNDSVTAPLPRSRPELRKELFQPIARRPECDETVSLRAINAGWVGQRPVHPRDRAGDDRTDLLGAQGHDRVHLIEQDGVEAFRSLLGDVDPDLGEGRDREGVQHARLGASAQEAMARGCERTRQSLGHLAAGRAEDDTAELQSLAYLVSRLLLSTQKKRRLSQPKGR